ncbi:MAG: carboxypeptidase-like regulatory domain-containing protein, partial [Bacteroidia bacterium]
MNGQPCSIKLKVIDSIDNSVLSYASISYKDSVANWRVEYTDENGYFEYTLSNSHDVILLYFSYLGYKEMTYNFDCKANNSTVLVVKMQRVEFLLKEIVITDTFPSIIQKKDTIIYATDKFTNGNEVKLKEILKKLPGVQVNQNNEITVNGEKVKEVLVEGETFFTGDAA